MSKKISTGEIRQALGSIIREAIEGKTDTTKANIVVNAATQYNKNLKTELQVVEKMQLSGGSVANWSPREIPQLGELAI